MTIQFYGPGLYMEGVGGVFRPGAATVFPKAGVLLTTPPTHHEQRQAYCDQLDAMRASQGTPPLTDDERIEVMTESVDLVITPETILIRAEPTKLKLVFAADELLLAECSKMRIRFVLYDSDKVLEEIKHRGEWWRIATPPQSRESMIRSVRDSRHSISGRRMYYYSTKTGIRWLTLQEFRELESLNHEELRQHLLDIQKYCKLKNSRRNYEVSFFLADGLMRRGFREAELENADPASLREQYRTLRDAFAEKVHPRLRVDDTESQEWLYEMSKALEPPDEDVTDLSENLGLGPEFLRTILWLPGARIVEGQLVFDSIFCEDPNTLRDPHIIRMSNERVREIIFDFVRDYVDLVEINVGQIVERLSKGTRPEPGHRDLYVVVMKRRSEEQEIIEIVRMQKYDVGYYLDKGYSLEEAMIQSEEYSEYTKDRYYGCRRLGMDLDGPVRRGRIRASYFGKNHNLHNSRFWIPLVQREYVHGIASNRIPKRFLQKPDYALRFAELMGWAAATNLIVGRGSGYMDVYFDDGDEVILDDGYGMPKDLIVTHHTGSFWHFRSPLVKFAEAYAAPVNSRREIVPNPKAFAEAYVEALITHFKERQSEYRENPESFNSLFNFRPVDPNGSFAYRWKRVLERLDKTDAEKLKDAIWGHIHLENGAPQ